MSTVVFKPAFSEGTRHSLFTLEARVQAGQFREPLIKLTHFLRAMEFEDAAKRSIFFDEVQEAIGQARCELTAQFSC